MALISGTLPPKRGSSVVFFNYAQLTPLLTFQNLSKECNFDLQWEPETGPGGSILPQGVYLTKGQSVVFNIRSNWLKISARNTSRDFAAKFSLLIET